MIRLAEHKDTKIILDLLVDFLQNTSYQQASAASTDREHLCKLIWLCQQQGYIWLAFKNQQPVGLLMSVRNPNMWNPKIIELKELVWYVVAEHRNSTLGGRLFAEFCQQAEQLKQQGLIDVYFTTHMTTTAPINLERRGFRLTETTYIKE